MGLWDKSSAKSVWIQENRAIHECVAGKPLMKRDVMLACRCARCLHDVKSDADGIGLRNDVAKLKSGGARLGCGPTKIVPLCAARTGRKTTSATASCRQYCAKHRKEVGLLAVSPSYHLELEIAICLVCMSCLLPS